MKTLRPLCFNNNAKVEAKMPFPNEETTPPVTKMNLLSITSSLCNLTGLNFRLSLPLLPREKDVLSLNLIPMVIYLLVLERGQNMFKSIKAMDLTKGNLFWKIPVFALPIALTSVFQLLYTTIDLWTVSQFGGGSNSMSAVGSNSALINLIITLFVSLSMGANVSIGNAKGANDHDAAEKILHTSIIVALIAGVFVGIIGFFLAPFMLELMGTPESILDNASTYLRIYFAGLPFLMLYNYGAQMMRGLGDSNTPFFILMISGIVNVVLDFVFVYFFNMDVAGVAVATVISEAVSALLTLLVLFLRKKSYVHLEWKKMRIDGKALKDVMAIGVPSGLQGIAFSFPNVLIQSSLYTISDYSINGIAISQDEIVAGSSASAQIEGYIYALVEGFGSACMAFTSQNYGAKHTKNCRKSFLYAQIWVIVSMGICALIAAIFPYQLLSIFITDSEGFNQTNALMAGRERLWLMAFTYALDAIMIVNSNYLKGLRHGAVPAIITLLGCTGTRILFLLCLFPLDYFHTIYWLYAGFPISWIIVDLVYIPVIIVYQKKTFARLEANEEPKPSKAQA